MKSSYLGAAVLGLATLITTPAFAQQAAPVFQPAPQQGAAGGRTWTASIQGFNIVLLVGEMQGASGPVDDLPQGARRALNDMKEFLPYKHYRVLDSQWTSCCAQASLATLSGRLQGVVGTVSATDVRLVPRPYMFNLAIQPGGDKLQVQFGLREEDGGSRNDDLAAERQLQNLVEDFQIAKQRLEEEKKRVAVGVLSPRDLRPLEDQVVQIERQIAAARAEAPAQRSSKGGRSVINSSFTMDVGETVVVGTSRLGGDKALIALVTAAKRSGTTAREDEDDEFAELRRVLAAFEAAPRPDLAELAETTERIRRLLMDVRLNR
jgi:hypothetical protein